MNTFSQKLIAHAELALAAVPRARAAKAGTITVMLYGEVTYWKPDGRTPIVAPSDKPWSIQIRVFDRTGEADQVLEELPPPLSPFAQKMLNALQRLTKGSEAHPCGGFTTDDMQWRMGTAFTPQEVLDAALEELVIARQIRYAGHDDEDAIGSCYELGVEFQPEVAAA